MPRFYPSEYRRRVIDLIKSGMSVAEFAEQAAVVEPVDPFEGGEFEVVEAPPGALVANQFGLVGPEHRFGQGVVVGVPA